MREKKAVVLVSEGLDSLLTLLLLKKQGIEVLAVKFITPFFGWQYKKEPEIFKKKLEEFGVKEVKILDITEEFLEVLKAPKYGYGSYANPCIDCKVLMLKKAHQLLKEAKASFIATGEVLGQRPMSQNKASIELIEKKAGVCGLVLRPLSAKLFAPTEAEKKGLVSREELFDIYGRRRVRQFELAKKLGLKEIPSPSGGCLLTDPQIGSRVLGVIKEKRPLTPLTCELLTFGRHFFEEGLWVVLGRNQEENKRLFELVSTEYPCYSLNYPAPSLAVIEGTPPENYLKSLLLKYSKKARTALERGEEVKLERLN
jgi:tRNA U34 2-thiouridine synthase MnmA/TrmU